MGHSMTTDAHLFGDGTRKSTYTRWEKENMKPVIYIRASLAEEEEKQAAAEHFPIVERRTAIPPDSLVIPRYSALPYNEDQQ